MRLGISCQINYTAISEPRMTFKWPQSPARMSADEFMEWLEAATPDQLEMFANGTDGWLEPANYSEFRLWHLLRSDFTLR